MDSKWKGELPAAGLFVVAICLGLIGRNNKPETVTAGVQREEPAKTEVVLGAKIAETGTGITVTKADDWSSEFTNEYETFMQNNENDEASPQHNLLIAYQSPCSFADAFVVDEGLIAILRLKE